MSKKSQKLEETERNNPDENEKNNLERNQRNNLEENALRINDCITNMFEDLSSNLHTFAMVAPIFFEKKGQHSANIIIIEPNVDEAPGKLEIEIQKVAYLIQRMEDRRKYAAVYCRSGIYIIGGYMFDAKKMRRMLPENDYVYRDEQIRAIPPLPGGMINFGCGTNGKYIVTVGGQLLTNRISNRFYRFHMGVEKWQRGPDIPQMVAGSGVLCLDDDVLVIGGYDVILGMTDFSPETFVYRRMPNKWIRLSRTIPRARPMVFIAGNRVCVAGSIGFHNGRVGNISDVSTYDTVRNEWNHLTNIPDMTDQKGIGFADEQLIVMERVTHPVTKKIISVEVTDFYDFDKNHWIHGSPPITKAKRGNQQPTSSRCLAAKSSKQSRFEKK